MYFCRWNMIMGLTEYLQHKRVKLLEQVSDVGWLCFVMTSWKGRWDGLLIADGDGGFSPSACTHSPLIYIMQMHTVFILMHYVCHRLWRAGECWKDLLIAVMERDWAGWGFAHLSSFVMLYLPCSLPALIILMYSSPKNEQLSSFTHPVISNLNFF